MSVTFGLWSPDHTTAIAAPDLFVPSMEPLALSPTGPVDGNAITHEMASGRIYTYRRGDLFRTFGFRFFFDTLAELNAYIAFFDGSRGRSFELRSLDSTPSYVTVKWSPTGLRWTPEKVGTHHWRVPAEFRQHI